MKKILLFIIILTFANSAQTKDPDKILNEVKKNFNTINDYVVDVSIKIDVSFLKVPDTKAKIFYKQPDKVHIESKGFALLPKGALDISPTSLLKGNYTALYDRVEVIDGYKTTVLKTIPIGENSDVILSTFWIDQAKNRMIKVEVSTKVNGTFIIYLKYSDKIKYPQLPSSIVFSFNVAKLNIPKSFTGEVDKDKQNYDQPNIGKVYIDYSNYIIDNGIPDSVFTKPPEKLNRKR